MFFVDTAEKDIYFVFTEEVENTFLIRCYSSHAIYRAQF